MVAGIPTVIKQVLMKVTIREIDNNTIQHIKKYGSSFEVRSKLIPGAEQGKISYTIVDVSPYTKQYGEERVDPETYIDNPDRIVFFAYLKDELVGQIKIMKNCRGCKSSWTRHWACSYGTCHRMGEGERLPGHNA